MLRGATGRWRSLWQMGASALVLASVGLVMYGQPPADSSVVVSFGQSSLSLEGVEPGDRFAVLGVGRDRVAYRARTLRFDEVVTADATGAARYELPEGEEVPPRSVWAVVDLASGTFVLAAPEGAEPQRIEVPARGLGAAARSLEQDGRMLDVLLVRPAAGPAGADGAGLWALRAGDGGRSDSDGEANGRLSLRVLDLIPLSDSPPAPETLAAKDVLIGVDPRTLEIYAVQLAAPPADGEGE